MRSSQKGFTPTPTHVGVSLQSKRGFTLLELLIVVVIISILAIAVLFVLNPAETLRKTRDAQRFADLGTLKNSMALFITTKTTPYIGGYEGAQDNAGCRASTSAAWLSGDKIWYSVHDDDLLLTDTSLDGGSSSIPAPAQATSSATNSLVDGQGWIPVAFSSLSGGSPISNLPVDPTNTISSASAIASTDKVYRYACEEAGMTFELNARLESLAFTTEDNRMVKDGGNNSNLYEVGTSLIILGTGTDF